MRFYIFDFLDRENPLQKADFVPCENRIHGQRASEASFYLGKRLRAAGEMAVLGVSVVQNRPFAADFPLSNVENYKIGLLQQREQGLARGSLVVDEGSRWRLDGSCIDNWQRLPVGWWRASPGVDRASSGQCALLGIGGAHQRW